MGAWPRRSVQVGLPQVGAEDLVLDVVRGDPALGSIVDNAHATEVLALARQGSDARIEEAGHSIHRDQAADFAAVVVPYLSGRA